MSRSDFIHPPFLDGNWSNENCYRFAINQTGSNSDPGKGDIYTSGMIDVNKLQKAIVSDGATLHGDISRNIALTNMPARNIKPGYYLIAVKADSNAENYHVIRRDESTGNWYQKFKMAKPDLQSMASANFNPEQDDWLTFGFSPTSAAVKTRSTPKMVNQLTRWVGYFWVPDEGFQSDQNNTRCKGCYITTATCITLGLADDCEQLTLLRWFRDNYLLTSSQGRKDIAEYYKTAPKIVRAINTLDNPISIYHAIYNSSLLPACIAIKNRNYAQAYCIYKRLVNHLKKTLLGE